MPTLLHKPLWAMGGKEEPGPVNCIFSSPCLSPAAVRLLFPPWPAVKLEVAGGQLGTRGTVVSTLCLGVGSWGLAGGLALHGGPFPQAGSVISQLSPATSQSGPGLEGGLCQRGLKPGWGAPPVSSGMEGEVVEGGKWEEVPRG